MGFFLRLSKRYLDNAIPLISSKRMSINKGDINKSGMVILKVSMLINFDM